MKCLKNSPSGGLTPIALRLGLREEGVFTTDGDMDYLFKHFTRDGKVMNNSAFLKMVNFLMQNIDLLE